MNITTSIRTEAEGTARIEVTVTPAGGHLTDTGFAAAEAADTTLAAARLMRVQSLSNYWDCTSYSTKTSDDGQADIHTYDYILTTPDFGPEL